MDGEVWTLTEIMISLLIISMVVGIGFTIITVGKEGFNPERQKIVNATERVAETDLDTISRCNEELPITSIYLAIKNCESSVDSVSGNITYNYVDSTGVTRLENLTVNNVEDLKTIFHTKAKCSVTPLINGKYKIVMS